MISFDQGQKRKIKDTIQIGHKFRIDNVNN